MVISFLCGEDELSEGTKSVGEVGARFRVEEMEYTATRSLFTRTPRTRHCTGALESVRVELPRVRTGAGTLEARFCGATDAGVGTGTGTTAGTAVNMEGFGGIKKSAREMEGERSAGMVGLGL